MRSPRKRIIHYALNCGCSTTSEICPEMHASKKMAKISQNRHIRRADFASTNSTRIRQNSQFRHADFALTNLIKIVEKSRKDTLICE